MTETTLDHAIIQELQSVMGQEGFRALVDSFVRDSRHRLELLDNAIQQGEPDEVRQTAHSFKGSSGNLGATELSGLCLELEQTGRSGDLNRAPEVLEQMRQAFERAQQELQTLAERSS